MTSLLGPKDPQGRIEGDGSDDDLEPRTDRLVAGVCAALADRFGFSALAIRASFVVLSVAGGFGVLLYGAIAALAQRPLGLFGHEPESVGVAQPNVSKDIGLGVMTLGVIWELQSWWPGFRAPLVMSVALVALALVVGWRGIDDEGPRFGSLFFRIGTGGFLILVALATIFGQSVELGQLRDSGLAVVVALAGIGIVAAPPLFRFGRNLNAERDNRVRQQERADLAAHLHDSVLQTLTLIQKRPDAPPSVTSLARRQERELRRWLYTGMVGSIGDVEGHGFAGLLQLSADDVEDRYEVTVEAVIISDVELNEPVASLLAASREAMVNAAKFSGEQKISLFAEVSHEGIAVFVRDRGKGFDPEIVAEDRRGLRDSIRGRMRNAGGSVSVVSSVGAGCEVSLHLPAKVLGER